MGWFIKDVPSQDALSQQASAISQQYGVQPKSLEAFQADKKPEGLNGFLSKAGVGLLVFVAASVFFGPVGGLLAAVGNYTMDIISEDRKSRTDYGKYLADASQQAKAASDHALALQMANVAGMGATPGAPAMSYTSQVEASRNKAAAQGSQRAG